MLALLTYRNLLSRTSKTRHSTPTHTARTHLPHNRDHTPTLATRRPPSRLLLLGRHVGEVVIALAVDRVLAVLGLLLLSGRREARRPSASRPKVWSSAPAVETRIARRVSAPRETDAVRRQHERLGVRLQCAAIMADNVDICGEPSGDCGRVGVEHWRWHEFGGARRRSGHAKATLRHRLVDLCPLDAVKGTARASRLWPNWPNWPKRLVHSPFETCEQAQWVLR